MRYPARKKQDNGCGLHVQRRWPGEMEKVARMVECHDNHDEAANNVDGVDAFHSLMQYTSKDASAKESLPGKYLNIPSKFCILYSLCFRIKGIKKYF